MGRKMSDEQKKAAGERLAKARALKNPPKYKNIHPSVLARDDADPLSMKSVRGWIKTQRELLKAERDNNMRGVKGALAKMQSIQGYIRQLEYYLANGDYVAPYWGEYEQSKTKPVCIAMAYDEDGFPKRVVGVHYSDIGGIWTKEMDDDKRGIIR